MCIELGDKQNVLLYPQCVCSYTLSCSQSACWGCPLVILESLWTCCGFCVVSIGSEIALLHLVLTSKVHNCPHSPQSQANCNNLTCLFLGLQEWSCFPFFWTHSPWFSTLVLTSPVLVGHPLASLPHLNKMGWKPRLLKAHLLIQAGRGKDVADTVGMYRECLCWQRAAGSFCSLRHIVWSLRELLLG